MANKIVKHQIRMTEELSNKYKEKAQSMGITMTSLVTIALNEYLKQEDMTKTIIEMVQAKTLKNDDNNA